MTELLLKIGISNACFSLALALAAVVIAKTTRRPYLANLLWLLVLVKLVTPPLVTIPGFFDTTVAVENHSQPSTAPLSNDIAPAVSQSPGLSDGNVLAISQPGPPPVNIFTAALQQARRCAPPVWLLGSVVVLVWSLVRVCRFGGLLAAESRIAPQQLQSTAVKIARRLKLRAIPTICTTRANLSPMVWWVGGKVRVVLPTTLIDRMDSRQLKWVLAHELAHVRRRDYLVRWIEWLACVSFWWNPVVWWAQRNLRATEEICCDALVISSLNPKPHSYAKSILAAVESLVRPAIRPPAMASEVNSGGFLERRFKMIVSNHPNRSRSRWLQSCVLLCAVIVLPLGAASAQDLGAVWKRLQTAVKKGEITEKQSHMMMGVLKESMKNRRDERREKRPDRDKIDAREREVHDKLSRAVKEGRMSRKDAERKMGEIKREALSRFNRKDEDHRKERRGEDRSTAEQIGRWVKSVGEDIHKALVAGKITGEQAARKWRGFKEHQLAPKLHAAVREGKMSEHAVGEFWRHIEIGEAGYRLQQAVRKGEISEDDARRKMGEIEREIRSRFEGRDRRDRADHERRAAHEHLNRVREDIHRAVREGRISKEDAHSKMEHVEREVRARFEDRQREHHKDPHREAREHMGRIREEIDRALREGRISKEDARRKMEHVEREIRSRFEGREKREHDRGERPKPDRDRHNRGQDERARTDEHVRQIWEGLQAAVREGVISEEEAHKKMGEIKHKIYSRFKDRGPREHHEDPDRRHREDDRHRKVHERLRMVWEKLQHAVREGKMSREDAERKMGEIKRKALSGFEDKDRRKHD